MKHLALTFLLTGLSLQSLLAWGGPGPWANGAYYPGQLDGRYSANVYNNTQDRGDYSEMDTPSGNTVRTDTFSTNVGSVTTSFETNFIGGVTTNYTTNYVTNIVTSGAAGVVSGVVGFGISGGSPSVSSNGTTAGIAGSINTDSSENYFVIYVDGNVFSGQTAAGINLGTKKVAGSFLNGTGLSSFEKVTNTTIDGGFRITTTTYVAVPSAAAGGYFNAKIKSDKSPFTFKGAGEISTRSTSQSDEGNATYPFNLDGIKVSDN